MKRGLSPLILILVASLAVADLEPGERDGQVQHLENGQFIAWDAEGERWLSPEAFWQQFAERRRGNVWPASTTFPPYADVNEHDTILLVRDDGPCLMYFFHRRWRRANDVWRWGPEFNDYGGCPNVFD